jgi:hypothetical protein
MNDSIASLKRGLDRSYIISVTLGGFEPAAFPSGEDPFGFVPAPDEGSHLVAGLQQGASRMGSGHPRRAGDEHAEGFCRSGHPTS